MATTGKEPPPPLQAAGPHSAFAGGQLPTPPEGGGVHGTNAQGSKTGKWGGQIPGTISEHLGSAMPGPPLGYFNFVSQNVPPFP